MSMQDPSGGTQELGHRGSGNTDIVVQLQSIVSQLSALVSLFRGRASYGNLTLPAAATLVVTNSNVGANSFVTLTPTNAAAATLMAGTKALYVSTLTAGVSFTVATADGTAATGAETFSYSINTPT